MNSINILKISNFNIRYISLISILLLVLTSNAQQTGIVDFIRVTAQIEPLLSEKKVKGIVTFTFKILKKTDSIFVDAKKMKITYIPENPVSVGIDNKKIWFTHNFEIDKTYSVSFMYEALPKQALYFTEDQIWTQGQGKYTSHWLPSIDDINEKIEFDLTIIAENSKKVIANGNLVSEEKAGNLKKWNFDMKLPMSSYLVAFSIGDLDVMTLNSHTGIPIHLYYKPKDSLKAEPTYRYSKVIFDFLETEIGISYPWQNYKQVPVRDFLYAGMENTTATIFSEAFVIDSIGFVDRNYVNVNAHELAHHWFGNLITETSGTHHWLQEGFATYYALLAEKEIFGDEYFYWKLFQSAEQLKAMSDDGKGESLLNPKASSLTFYEKGAWALHILKEEVGEEVFKKSVKNYLEKYQFKNVTTNDFISEVEDVFGKELVDFKTNWLQQSAFKSEEAYQSLIKSPFIINYFEISALRKIPLKDKISELEKALDFPDDFIAQEVIYQIEEEDISETIQLYKIGFKSNNLFVRQAIALSLSSIPMKLKTEYESLLKDRSYVTKEAALYNLWTHFPEDRSKYLDALEGVEGFQNKNIYQLWLVLAFVTEDYKVDEKSNYLNKIKGFTSPQYSFEIRELALGYLNELGLWDDPALKNLVNACIHQNWRFRKSSRVILNYLIESEIYVDTLLKFKNDLDLKESQFLKKVLDSN